MGVRANVDSIIYPVPSGVTRGHSGTLVSDLGKDLGKAHFCHSRQKPKSLHSPQAARLHALPQRSATPFGHIKSFGIRGELIQSLLRLNQELNGCSGQMQHVAGIVRWDIYNLRALPVTGKPVANRWNTAL
jgi:hypothetical protein